MELKTLAKPREQILALVAILGILVLFFRTFYFPKRIEKSQLEVQIQNLKLEKEALEKFTQALLKQVPKAGKEETPPKIRILKGEMAPFAQETSHLLAQISTPEFLKGVRIKKMSDLPPQKREGYSQSNFLINAQGPFQNVYSFLDRTEHFPALMVVDNITLKALDSKAANVELEMNGTLFHLEKGK